MSDKQHHPIPNKPPTRIPIPEPGVYAIDDRWMTGVIIVWAHSVGIGALDDLTRRMVKETLISTTLASKWGAFLVLVESEDLHDAIVAKHAPRPETGCGYEAWATSGYTGLSSKYMAYRLMPKKARYAPYAHPHDAEDVERCMLLLECVPEINVDGMCGASPQWERLVERWDEIADRIRLDEREEADAVVRECVEGESEMRS